MRTILVVAATFACAFAIISFTASAVENWATAQRHVEPAYMAAGQPGLYRDVDATTGLFSTRR